MIDLLYRIESMLGYRSDNKSFSTRTCKCFELCQCCNLRSENLHPRYDSNTLFLSYVFAFFFSIMYCENSQVHPGPVEYSDNFNRIFSSRSEPNLRFNRCRKPETLLKVQIFILSGEMIP